MKSILVTYDQAYENGVHKILSKRNVRGYTGWNNIVGAGTHTGEPHHGSHAWPSLNNAIIIVVEDDKVKPLLEDFKELDSTSDLLGIRAFVWNIEDGM